jgi:hypothetical protein
MVLNGGVRQPGKGQGIPQPRSLKQRRAAEAQL